MEFSNVQPQHMISCRNKEKIRSIFGEAIIYFYEKKKKKSSEHFIFVYLGPVVQN